MRALPSSRRSHISRPRDHRQDGGRSLLSPPRTCRHSNPKLKSPTSPKASHVAKSPQVCPHGDAKMGGRDVSQRPMTNVGADKDGYMTSHLFICRDHRRACRGRDGQGSDALDRRPQLAAALAEARSHGKGCPIAVAKLDRLSRDVHFISGLMAHKTPFLVADLGPDVEPSCRTCTPTLPAALFVALTDAGLNAEQERDA